MKEDIDTNCASDLSAIVGALLNALDDKCENVREAIMESIQRIAKQDPLVVVNTSLYFRELHRKMSPLHVDSLLEVMADTCRDQAVRLDADLASSVAELAVNELITGNAKEKACELLVILGGMHCTQAMGALLAKFEPGVKPYYRIIQTMGMLAAGNVSGMIPFIKVTMNIMLPMLDHVREERLKQAFCFTLGKFAEAINDYIINADDTSDPGISKDTFKTEITSAFDILTTNWLNSNRDSKLIEGVLKALGPMLLFLPEDSERRRTAKLIPVILHFCKKSNTRLAATRVLAMLLNCAIEVEEDKEILRSYLEQMHQILSDFVSITPFEASREVLLTHYEVLRCYHTLVILYPDEGLDQVLQQLKSITSIQRSRALVVLRHLINILPAKDDAVLQRIALNLQDSLGETSARQVLGAIATLVAKSTISLSPSQRAAFVQFMVTHCEPGKDEAEACEEALHLLATTVEGAESWLWPLLLQSLLDSACITSVVPVARTMSAMTVKIIRDQGCAALREQFESTKVLGRCLELLSDKIDRIAVVTLLRCFAPLFGQHLKELWDRRLSELIGILENERIDNSIIVSQRAYIWEEKIVELLEESVKLEGEAWGLELADELANKLSVNLEPGIAPLLAAVSTKVDHTALLVELAHNHGASSEFSIAVGICSRRHPGAVLKLMEDSCIMEDSRKLPVKLLGLVKDSKAAATAEAAKTGLLRSYAEIARRAESAYIFSAFDKHALPWIIRQLNDCKELTTKEAGLLALEQIGCAAHTSRLADTTGLRARSSALATLLTLLQAPSGHRSLQLYSSIFKATISLLEVPPTLNPNERNILLSTMLDKVLGASSEINLLPLKERQHVMDGLGTVCSKVVSDSADALAEFVDMVLPWIQSKSYPERKATLLLLRDTLRSYHDSLKYTYPGGKLEPGRLLGKILPLCADPEPALRSLVVDCTCHSLNIGARHRSTLPDNNLDKNLNELREKIISEDSNIFYNAIQNLAATVSEKVAGGEAVGLAEGLIESLLFRDENSLAAGIALSQLFKIRGSDLPHAAVHLIDRIIVQMRKMDNVSCRHMVTTAVTALMMHHPQEVIESLLNQPLPLDRGTEECWKEVGTDKQLGQQAVELLLVHLDNNNLFNENQLNPDKNNSVALSSLAAIIAMGHLLQSSKSDILIEKQLAKLLSILLTYLAGWLHVAAPTSTAIVKFGFVPNRETYKLNPYKEVYSVLINILTIVDLNVASSLLNETVFNSESEAEESLVSTVSSMVRCLLKKSDVLSNLAHFLGKLAASPVPAQRAVSAAFYAELIGKVDCGVIWLDAIINSLHEAKTDSSPLVRKLAIIGLARIARLEYDQIEEYLDNCIAALLDGLDEPASGDGGSEVVLESLRGLSMLLSVQREKPLSPRIVLALKPFIEKESWEMRLAAINSLGAIVRGWQTSVVTPNDDITNHLLGCLSCLIVRLEDLNLAIALTVKETLHDLASLLQCESLNVLMCSHMDSENYLNIENFLRELICCLQRELPQTAEDIRNAVSRGYSRSENSVTRATSALILGLYGQPRSEDVQRLLQLLHDEASNVRARAARALSLCFTETS